MPTAVKEINTLLETLDVEDYTVVLDYVRLIAQNRKKQRALDSIEAMNEFHSVLNGDKGWNSEEEMLEDMAEFRRSRFILSLGEAFAFSVSESSNSLLISMCFVYS